MKSLFLSFSILLMYIHSQTVKKEENYIEAKAFYFSQDMIKQFDWAKYNQQDNQNCAIEM